MCLPVFPALPDRPQLRLKHIVQELLYLDIAQPAARIVRLELVQILIIRKELLKMLRTAERIQIDEYRIAVYLSRILHTQVVRVGKHRHDFFLDLIRLIRKVNAVAERFAHLCLSVNTRQTQACLIVRKDDLRIGQGLTVNGIELMHDLLTLLQHRQLILADRNSRRAECRDICRLTDRIAEEANRNARLKIPLLDLGLHSRIALYTGNRHEIHIVESQLGQLRNHRLNEDRGLRRVNATCQIVKRDLNDILSYLLRMLRIVCQCLRIRNHNINLIELTGILQSDTSFQ